MEKRYQRSMSRDEIRELFATKYDDLVERLRPYVGGPIQIDDWKRLRPLILAKVKKIDALLDGVK